MRATADLAHERSVSRVIAVRRTVEPSPRYLDGAARITTYSTRRRPVGAHTNRSDRS